MVCLSVGWSVCHSIELCKSGLSDRDAVWVVDSGKPKEPLDGVQIPTQRGSFEVGNVIGTTNGWMAKISNSSAMERELLEKCRTKCISVSGNYAEKRQNMMNS